MSISDPFSRRTFLLTSVGALAASAQSAPDPPRKLRRDSFFGFHFDLHPSGNDKVLGRDLTEEHIQRLLERTKPDFIQYDCKGHAGWLGYPSKVSPSSPGIVRDSLAMWRKVTARQGVALYIHFSGVWDSLAVETHPEWARIDAAGKPDTRQTSTFGPYVDQRMIPQLEEVSQKYDLDGVWVDGECWATNPDYRDEVKRAFGEPLPRGSKDPRWNEFLEFNRAQFRRYLRHYIGRLHETRPKFQIASNWLYTTYVPEKPEIPADYISGDYLGSASVATARVESRYLSATGKTWDLMAWGFHSPRTDNVGTIHKTADQLMQEASVVLMQGGGFQVYYQPSRAGRFDDLMVETMGKVADFCRPRRHFCHRTEPVPQVGVVFSGCSLYQTSNKLFGGWGKNLTAPVNGMVAALAEAHFLVDIVPDWKLDNLRDWPMLVVPDWLDIGAEAQARLTEYVKNGGLLLVTGAANGQRFAELLGLKLTRTVDETSWVAGSQMPGSIRGQWLSYEAPGAESIAMRHPTSDLQADPQIAATLHRVGSGKIALIAGPVGFSYDYSHSAAIRDFLKGVMTRLYEPGLSTTAPSTVEFALRRKGPNTVLHMANMTNMQVSAEYMTVDFIPPLGPFDIKLRLPARPSKTTLEPGGKPVTGSWNNGWWSGRIDSLHIHSALVFA